MIDAHEKGFFTEENSVEVVTSRNATATDQRLKRVMEVVTRKLHEAVKELEPTQEEWMEAILFLTRTGHTCNEWRQEFILLSDVLGVSMLVDAINNRKPSGASESTVLGPFHVADAPELPMGANICLDQKGEDMFIHGRILDTEGRPITDAVLDVPMNNRFVAACRGCGPAVRTDRQARYRSRMTFQHKPHFLHLPVPDPHRPVVRSRNQCLSIGRESQAVYVSRVSPQRAHKAVVRPAPEADDVISAPCRQQFPLRMKDGAEGPILVRL